MKRIAALYIGCKFCHRWFYINEAGLNQGIRTAIIVYNQLDVKIAGIGI